MFTTAKDNYPNVTLIITLIRLGFWSDRRTNRGNGMKFWLRRSVQAANANAYD
jgi:hypothetical protein